MRILGISALRRDAAAALVVDGQLVACAQEERMTKERLHAGLPKRAMRACLETAGIHGRDLDQVVFYEKPLRRFERSFVSQLRAFPRSARVFSRDMFAWLGENLWLRGQLAEELGVPEERVRFADHELSHAAAAWYSSPFDEAAVLVLDDVGEWATTLLAKGQGTQLESVRELHHPHSLGLFASAICQFLGFEAGCDEPLVEALSAWGQPRFKDQLAELLPALEGGCFELDASAFRLGFDSDVLFGKALVERLGPHREPGAALRFQGEDRRDADLAASLQALLEERALGLAHELHQLVPSTRLCLGGQLALNTRLVARLFRDGPFEELHVAPAPSKAGAALGAALLAHHMFQADAKRAQLEGCSELDSQPAVGAVELEDEPSAIAALAGRLAEGHSVAWMPSPLELGTRSLASRVLLIDACREHARERLLSAVQRGEPFQPACLVLPAARAAEFVELPAGRSAPGPLGRGQLSLPATSTLEALAPDAVLPDGRVWVRLVDQAEEPAFAALLQEVEARTGTPLCLSTSFHLRGAPIVRTELDAHEAFQRSSIDALIVGTRLYERSPAAS